MQSAVVPALAMPTFSVVVPVYNEAGNAVPLLREIDAVLHELGAPFEIIFVNDGSTDATLAQLRGAAAQMPVLRVLDLDRNSGEAAALCAGFRSARGALVITLDGDGQNDPHDIPLLLEMLHRSGYRVVSGWRQERQAGQLLRVWPSRLANRLIAYVTRIPVHDNGCGLKVYRRAVVASAALPHGMHRFLPSILGVRADEVAEVPVRDRRRQHGQSHYGIGRTLIVMRDLLALRSIIATPRRREPIAVVVTIIAVAAAATGVWIGSPGLVAAAAPVGAVGALIWWNLRRFNRAQRHGVFRVRREYSALAGWG